MNTHGLIVDFGKWNGHLYTRVPVQYLKWMVQSGHSKAEIAKAELERRGTVTPELDITGHAIDSASNRLLGMWTSTKKDGEGLHAWLCRVALEAFRSGTLSSDNAIIYKGVKWIFEPGEWPVLKTVMPKGAPKSFIDNLNGKQVDILFKKVVGREIRNMQRSIFDAVHCNE